MSHLVKEWFSIIGVTGDRFAPIAPVLIELGVDDPAELADLYSDEGEAGVAAVVAVLPKAKRKRFCNALTSFYTGGANHSSEVGTVSKGPPDNPVPNAYDTAPHARSVQAVRGRQTLAL